VEVALFTLYILMWPAAAAAVLAVIIVAFARDFAAARREGKGRDIV
jgi:hypothetical protein